MPDEFNEDFPVIDDVSVVEPPPVFEEPVVSEDQQVAECFQDCPDDELFLCCHGHHPVGSASKRLGGVRVKGLLDSVPWSVIATMLVKLGLPFVQPAIVKLRDRIAVAAWPHFIKHPLLAAIDELLNDLNQLDAFIKAMAPRP
jgi:hypothetical protein